MCVAVIAVNCSVLQCVADSQFVSIRVSRRWVTYTWVMPPWEIHPYMGMRVCRLLVCELRGVLQCVAVCCSVLQGLNPWVSRPSVTYTWVISHMNESRHMWMRHATHAWECKGMSQYQIWISVNTCHVSHVNISFHTWMRHATQH